MPEQPTFTAAPNDPLRTNSLADSAATTGGEPNSADPAPPASPERYALGEEIARGGMGIVYRATDTAFGREVAVKVLQDRFGPTSGAYLRFADEARITGQLQHPGIPPAHDFGTLPDGRAFLAMKLVKGRTLDDQLRDRPDPAAERGKFVAVFEQVCHAVGYAHAHRVIHRDLKPANVMVGDYGEVQVMDWGLAKVLGEWPGVSGPSDAGETAADTRIHSLRDSDGGMTQAGSILGTPAFMPPEQALGSIGRIDARSDVFGLGAILAVVLTGRPPFAAGSAETTRIQAAQGKVNECFARLDACDADPELVALCKRCLAPEPADRPATAGEVARAVAGLRAAADERARQSELDRVAAESKTAEQRKRRKLTLVGGGVLCAVLLAGVVGTTIGLVRAREAKEAEGRRADGEKEAKENEEEALRVATSQIDLASDAFNDLILKIQVDLAEAPGGRHVRREILEDTMKKLHRLYDSPATSDRLIRRYSTAHAQMGSILWALNRQGEAEAEYKKAGEYVERSLRAFPTSDKAKGNLAAHHGRMGDVEIYYHKRLEPARKHYEAALLIWQQLADKLAAMPGGDPALPAAERKPLTEVEETLADTYDRLGLLCLRWDFDYPKAEEWFHKSLALRKWLAEAEPTREHRSVLATSYWYMAELALQRGDMPTGLSFHERVLRLREVLYKERPWSLKVRRELAAAQGKFGDDLMAARRDAEGRRHYLDSLRLYQQLLAAEPDDPYYRSLAAHAYYRAGTSYIRVGEKGTARKTFEDGLKLRQVAYDETKDERQRLNMQVGLMYPLARCGRHAEAAELAASVRKNLGVMPAHVVEAGTVYGLCMAAVGEGKPAAELTPEERQLRKQYLDLAIACFEEARQKKYDDYLFMSTDADFDVLRGVPEFDRWMDSFRRSVKKE